MGTENAGPNDITSGSHGLFFIHFTDRRSSTQQSNLAVSHAVSHTHAFLSPNASVFVQVNDEGYTPLMEAAREGHEEMVALLLAQGKQTLLLHLGNGNLLSNTIPMNSLH